MKRKVPLEEALTKKLPERAVQLTLYLLREGRVQLRITKPRLTKLGDFMPGTGNGPNKISINGDLNPFQFLWTLIHELAHLHTWNEYGRSVDPHGKEWRLKFKELMQPFLDGQIFTPKVTKKLRSHLQSAAASTCSDPELYKLLSSFDAQKKSYVDEVDQGEPFILKGGRMFIKGKKLRKRFECIDMSNGKTYLIHGHAEIEMRTEAV
jgi:hypothetical protein